jgi:hypothetical protein
MTCAGLRSFGETSPKLAEDEKRVRRRAKAGNPPVNSRITFVLPVFAAGCWTLLERAPLQRGQQVAHLPRDAARRWDLPRVVARERQEKRKVVAGGSEVDFVEIRVSLVPPLVA